MKTNLSPLQQAGAFIGLVLAFAIATALAIPSPAPEVAILPYMFTPMAAALVMMLVVTRDGWRKSSWHDLGLFNLGLRYWPVAIAAPSLVATAGLLAAYLLPSVTPTTPDNGMQLIIQSAILFVVATIGWSLGEEFGWRGYLLPRLRVLGDTKAILISGVVWAVYHLPIMLLTTLYHPEGDRLIVAPLFVVAVVGASFFFSYLRIFSGSVWPSSLAHTVHNLAWMVTGEFMIATSPVAEEYIAGDSGIVIAIGTVLAGVYLVWRERRRGPATATRRITLRPAARAKVTS
jgi:membrane protease YdiL (CAAX protease family)